MTNPLKPTNSEAFFFNGQGGASSHRIPFDPEHRWRTRYVMERLERPRTAKTNAHNEVRTTTFSVVPPSEGSKQIAFFSHNRVTQGSCIFSSPPASTSPSSSDHSESNSFIFISMPPSPTDSPPALPTPPHRCVLARMCSAFIRAISNLCSRFANRFANSRHQ